MRFLSALKQDCGDLLRWRPWGWKRKMEARFEALQCSAAAAIAYGNELEKQLSIQCELHKDLSIQVNDAILDIRVHRIEDEFATLCALQLEMDKKFNGVTAQIIEFGKEFEKLRLRLSVPQPEQEPEKPKDWRTQRRELEAKFATTTVAQENENAGKGKSS
ncbi:MAG TPA: hypothetical protein VIW68_12640 [Candidatus Sulfotelmatobacter sp.]